ncbi:MAG: ROK family transcriptional regulator [Kosmotoga sp.]|nr:MAG: ROK family transcriptional regulator [Kosmotoga sp.]
MQDLSRAEQQVFSVLWRNKKGLTRKSIAKFTELSKATISRVIQQLKEKKFVKESDPLPTTDKGRPYSILKVNNEKLLIGGVYIHSKTMNVVLGDLSGRVKHARSLDHSRNDVLEKLYELPKITGNSFEEDMSKVLVFSIVTPGIVDEVTGSVIKSFYTPKKMVNLKHLGCEWKTTLEIENDANALLVSEMLLGSIPSKDAMYIDREFGASLVLNGKIFRGPHGGAGEFGHLQIDPSGPQCWCGKKGCVSAYFDPKNLKQNFSDLVPNSSQKMNDHSFLDFLSEMYSENHSKEFIRLFEQLLDKLAAAITNVVDLLGLETIVLNNLNPFFSGKAVDYLRKKVFELSMRHAELEMIILKVTEQKLLRTPLAVSIARILGVI